MTKIGSSGDFVRTAGYPVTKGVKAGAEEQTLQPVRQSLETHWLAGPGVMTLSKLSFVCVQLVEETLAACRAASAARRIAASRSASFEV